MSGDNVRDEYLGRLGLTVCRYQNSEVMKNFDGVCTDIFIRLNGTGSEQTPHPSAAPTPSPQGRGQQTEIQAGASKRLMKKEI